MSKEPDYSHYAYRDDIDVTGGVALLFGIDTLVYPWEIRSHAIEQDLTGEKFKAYKILSSVQWHAI